MSFVTLRVVKALSTAFRILRQSGLVRHHEARLSCDLPLAWSDIVHDIGRVHFVIPSSGDA